MEHYQCDCCLEECAVVFPVFTGKSRVQTSYDWVCSSCADVVFDERIGNVYRQSLPFRVPGHERSISSEAA
jgi:hypothetical protein